MLRKGISWLALLVVFAALGLSACGGGGSSPSSSPAPSSPTGTVEGNAR